MTQEFEAIKDFQSFQGKTYKAGERGIFETAGFFNWGSNVLNVYPPFGVPVAPVKASDYLKVVDPTQLSSSIVTTNGEVSAWQYGWYAMLWIALIYFARKYYRSNELGKYTPWVIGVVFLWQGYDTFNTFKPVIMGKPKTTV